MPFTGGATPSPERYGGGDSGDRPLLQIVYQSLAAARGSAYDHSWPPNSAVAAENIAFARALALDGYGGNQRLANQFIPSKMTAVGGLLPRWETVFGVPPQPGDTDSVRRARVAAAWARLSGNNAVQAVTDIISTALGPIYGALTTTTMTNDAALWPGITGTAAKITAQSGGLLTVSNLAGILSSFVGGYLQLGNCNTAANNGVYPIHDYVSSSSVTIGNPGGTSPDNGVGGSGGSPTITWTVGEWSQPASNGTAAQAFGWWSNICHLQIQALLPAGYYTTVSGQKVPNALWWSLVAGLNSILDSVLPAWMGWSVYILNSASGSTFLLDEPNLDLEVLA